MVYIVCGDAYVTVEKFNWKYKKKKFIFKKLLSQFHSKKKEEKSNCIEYG